MQMHDTSLNMSTLMASWTTSVLYGINIVMYACCVRVLYHRGLVGFNRVLIIMATLQFFISTGHNAACLVQLIRGFITNGDTPNGPFIYFLDMASPEHVAQEAFYITNSVLGDAILIWRLYIVWNNNWWLCAPFATLVAATTICGYVAISHLAHFSPVDPVFLANLGNWLLSTWCLSLVTQVGATLLIAYKIWATTSWGINKSSSHMKVFWMVVESGAVYSFTTVILLSLYVAKENAGAIVGAALGQISCLVPTSIIVRTGLVSAATSTAGSFPSFRAATRLPRKSSQGSGTITQEGEIDSAQEICLTDMVSDDEAKNAGLIDLEKGNSLSRARA
ncbi:hypothetical protein C8F04DRAFT_1124802 [Mycena alexandri]|uniref:Uncharacterized protein n=1 Tax=Mycena alexandri TaxID=1745969 RepID=A0AAD6WVE7_9AGAR|nr:hypothetical protein C8F04DRAFT_1124802 [Mycena alexandri]